MHLFLSSLYDTTKKDIFIHPLFLKSPTRMDTRSESKLLGTSKPQDSTSETSVGHSLETKKAWINPDYEPYWSPPWMPTDLEDVQRTNSSLSGGSAIDVRSYTTRSGSKSSIDTAQLQHDDVRQLPPPPLLNEGVEVALFRPHTRSTLQHTRVVRGEKHRGCTATRSPRSFQHGGVELGREFQDIELALPTEGESDVDPPPGMQYKWETFNTEGFLKSREDCSNAHSTLTAITGLLGSSVTRLSKYHSDGKFEARRYYWRTAADRKGLLSTTTWAFLLVVVIPTAINFLLACLPLYELRRPVGTEGFVPLAENWGWLVHNYVELLFVDLVFMCTQTLYLSSTDHLYFSMWPTLLKVILASIIQDFIPRFFHAFPVRFLAGLTHLVLGVTVAVYHSWSFVTHELPKFERGRHTPTIVESFFSFGLSTVEKKRVWDKKMSSLLKQQKKFKTAFTTSRRKAPTQSPATKSVY
eukprot:gb/GECG01006533.1/.p1 GENE.gb/GECG01006533.1/~~gb/GECG01006533.1/.p1  ORF type:complete len:469 (+),score=38.67 gb/GECG01006533.1/:1-1407(+)